MERQSWRADEIIAELAGRSHGVVARRALLEVGIGAEQIRRRLQRGSLIRVHRGVYRVGHTAPVIEATFMAAVMACGDGALLSDRAAGFLWGLLKGDAPAPEVLARSERRVPGIAVRRARPFFVEDASICRGVPVTTVARTLVDLARWLTEPVLAQACHQGLVRFQIAPDSVESVLSRLPNARGARTLRRVLHGDVPVSLSRLEREFLNVLREERLPLPRTNRLTGSYRVDCRWPSEHLTVELDSYTFHGSHHAWDQDRHREREAYARGDQFRRYTWKDVLGRSGLMLRELRALLPALPD
jgi:very-short-patch-repair endonuclease